ncbi:MAG TPA: hypothetical protein DCF45_04630 [Gammaproteobacteria bacterium]|nr:hypothetical protein [Gammaproteobacteria bacterium]
MFRSNVAAALLILSVSSAASAATYDLDFSNANQVLSLDFGDNADANVSYRETLPQFGDVASGSGALRTWNAGYSDLIGVAYASTASNHGEIRIDANLPNSVITLHSFNLGAWNVGRPGSWAIYDSNWGLLGSGNNSVSATQHLSVFPDVQSSTGGLILQWGDNALLTGIDNVSYSVSSVPLPAAIWLFGFSLLGLSRLKRIRHSYQPLPSLHRSLTHLATKN